MSPSGSPSDTPGSASSNVTVAAPRVRRLSIGSSGGSTSVIGNRLPLAPARPKFFNPSSSWVASVLLFTRMCAACTWS